MKKIQHAVAFVIVLALAGFGLVPAAGLCCKKSFLVYNPVSLSSNFYSGSSS